LNTRNDLISINGHANHYLIGAPVGLISSSDVAGATGDHSRVLLYTVGCHSGLNVASDNPYQALDTAQAFIQQGANYVGNTGYGWGYLTSVGLSEQLMLDFSKRLIFGQSATLGQALVAAKQEYYLNEHRFDYYDEKIMIESTLYGLPMYRYTTPAAATAQLQSQDQELGVTSVTQTTLLGDGLTVNSFSYQFPALTAETTDEGDIYSLAGMTHANNGEPIQPKYTVDLSFPETEAHGVVFKGGVYTDVLSFDPVVDRAVTETTSLAEPTFEANGWYPAVPHRLNRLERSNRLVTLLGQYNPESQTERLYDKLSFDVYYHTSSDDWTPPSVTSIGSELQMGSVAILVEGEDESGIEAVVVAYTEDKGAWESISLTESTGTWSGSFPADENVQFFVQVVDKAGNVTISDHAGRYFRPGEGLSNVIYLPLVLSH
jgi:hypothetical protein